MNAAVGRVKLKAVCANCKLFEPSDPVMFEHKPHGWCNQPRIGQGRQPKAFRDRRHPLDWCEQISMKEA